MNENIIQWVMLKKIGYLQKCLGLSIKRKLVEYLSTDFGIIDFAVELQNGNVVIVELETEINSLAKLNYTIEQTKKYLNLKSQIEKPLSAIILYDKENTSASYIERLKEASEEIGVELRDYSLLEIKKLYQECFEELEKTGGIYLGRPVAMDVCYLKWLNRVIDIIEDQISFDALLNKFGKTNKTGLNVRLKLAENFDLVEVEGRGSTKIINLTELGKTFKENINYQIIKGQEIDLSIEQKRILIESLINGQFTKSKVNIYYLLRFIHLTNGEWVPKGKAEIEKEKIDFLNYFLGTSYKSTILTKLMDFTCNQCIELGLVDKIPTPKRLPTYQVVMTTMGSRVLGFLELYLHLKREQIQIPLQI